MPVHETDRTDFARRRSQEALEASHVSALGQRYMPKDRTSDLLDDESNHMIDNSQEYHDQAYVASQHSDNEERDLERGTHHAVDEVQIFEERSERGGEARQGASFSEERMNAVTRDLKEQPVTGMGNERQFDDISTGDQTQFNKLDNETTQLTEEQMNALTRDLREQPTAGLGNERQSVDLSSSDQDCAERIVTENELLTEERMNALTRDLKEQPVSGMGNERHSEDRTAGNEVRTGELRAECTPLAEEQINAITRELKEQMDVMARDLMEKMSSLARDLKEQPVSGSENLSQFEDQSSGREMQTEKHDSGTATAEKSSDLRKVSLRDDQSTTESSKQVEYSEYADDYPDNASLAAGIAAYSAQRNANDIQPANDSSSDDHEKSESSLQSAQLEQSAAGSQTDNGRLKGEIVEVEEIRTESKSQPVDEGGAKTDVSVDQPVAPSAPLNQTIDSLKDLNVKAEVGQEINTTTNISSDKRLSDATSGSNHDLEAKHSSDSRHEVQQEGVMQAKTSVSSDGSEKSDTSSYDENDPRAEHVDRNRETRALHKTNEALVATAHKLTYEAKHLAQRIKDTFTKKKHHEVKIWPDGVVMGDEPENQPEPAQFIKAAHDVVVKFNEQEGKEDVGEERPDSSVSADRREPAEENANDMKEAEERRAEEARASQSDKSCRNGEAKRSSETAVIASRTENTAKGPTKPEHEGSQWNTVKEMVDHKEFSDEHQGEEIKQQPSSDMEAVNGKEAEIRTTEVKEEQPQTETKVETVTRQKVEMENELMGDKTIKSESTDRPSEEPRQTAATGKEEASEQTQQCSSSLQSSKEVKEDAGGANHDAQSKESDADNKSQDESDSENNGGKQTFTPCNPTDLPVSERTVWWDSLEQEASKRVNENAKHAKPVKPLQANEAANNVDENITQKGCASEDDHANGNMNEKLKEKEVDAVSKAADKSKESAVRVSKENLQSPASDDEGVASDHHDSVEMTVPANMVKEPLSSNSAKKLEGVETMQRKETHMEASNVERSSLKPEQCAMDSIPSEDRKEIKTEIISVQSTPPNNTGSSSDRQQMYQCRGEDIGSSCDKKNNKTTLQGEADNA